MEKGKVVSIAAPPKLDRYRILGFLCLAVSALSPLAVTASALSDCARDELKTELGATTQISYHYRPSEHGNPGTFNAEALKAHPEELKKFVAYANSRHPDVDFAKVKGRASVPVDLSFYKNELIPWLKSIGKAPDEAVILIDGEKELHVPMSRLTAPGGSLTEMVDVGNTSRQFDLHFILRRTLPDGKKEEVYGSNWWMREEPEKRFARANPKSFDQDKVPHLRLPRELLAKTGRDPQVDLLEEAAKGLKTRFQVLVNPDSRNELLKTRFRDHGAQLDMLKVFEKDGDSYHWQVTDPLTGDSFRAEKDDIWDLLNAGFNRNLFRWDGVLTARGAIPHRPDAVLNALKAHISLQKRIGTGGVPREYRDWNMVGLQRARTVKLDTKGIPHSIANAEYPAPMLEPMLADEVLAVHPNETAQLLPELIHSMRWERSWWVREHGVKDKNGALLGFNWSNLGSGRDNAPRCLDIPGCLALDAIVYYKVSLDKEEKFLETLGRWDEADRVRKEADEIAAVIQKHYWNDHIHMYSDIMVKADSGENYPFLWNYGTSREIDMARPVGGEFRQTDVRTPVGFSPMMARIPDKTQVDTMIKDNLLNDEYFGGLPMMPSVSRSHAGNSMPEYHAGTPGPSTDVVQEAGGYWRFGPWPPDLYHNLNGLLANGRRGLAAEQHGLNMGAYQDALLTARMGYTPGVYNSAPYDWMQADRAIQEAGSAKTMPYEAFGFVREKTIAERVGNAFGNYQPLDFSAGRGRVRTRPKEPVGYRPPYLAGNANLFGEKNKGLRVAFNLQPSEHGVHQTRVGLGWSVAEETQSARVELGRFGLGGYHPQNGIRTPDGVAEYLRRVLTSRNYNDVLTGQIPSIAPIAREASKLSPVRFAAFLREKMKTDPVLKQQVERVANGYQELVPTFPPGSHQTSVEMDFNGVWAKVAIEDVGNGKFKLQVDSKDPIAWCLGRAYERKGRGFNPTDAAQAVSNVFMLGGSAGREMIVELTPH